ncbi:MAG: hypothetical protein J2P13_03940 [Acidobacteria bacterium]|nr:hypothetical protein [Acidobacteriota bacterium]
MVHNAPGKVEIEDQPRPSLGSGESEIAVEVAGICGSDISGLLSGSAMREPGACAVIHVSRPDGALEAVKPASSIRKEHCVVMSFACTRLSFRRSLDLPIAGGSASRVG